MRRPTRPDPSGGSLAPVPVASALTGLTEDRVRDLIAAGAARSERIKGVVFVRLEDHDAASGRTGGDA